MSEYQQLSIWEKILIYYTHWYLVLTGWRPIATAPRDGTLVLVLHTHDERCQVLSASWMTPYHDKDIDPPKPRPSWWSCGTARGYQHWDTSEPYGRADLGAISPLWWKPYPREPRVSGNLVWWWEDRKRKPK